MISPDVVASFAAVGKAYGAVRAVSDLDLAVTEGEIFGFVGPDGAGKTTALELLCGLRRPDSGTVRVFGLDPVTEGRRAAPLIGLVSQDFTLYGTLTVEENLDFFAAIHGVDPGRRDERKERLLGFARLAPFTERRAGALSGGMKKKLALCTALIHEPRLLVLDEPTTGVDPVSRRELWEIVFGFVERGITVVVTTPYMDEAEQCHRVALLADGELLALGTPDELRRSVDGEVLRVRGEPLRRIEEEARNVSGLLDATGFGDRVHLRVRSRETFLPELRRRLQAAGVNLAEALSIEPTMEDVFLARARSRPPESDRKLDASPRLPGARDRRGGEGEVAVRARGLTRRFGDFVAVKGIDLDVRPGEIFGFLGPNGAGKTTTIKMLCGLLPPSGGAMTVAGVDVVTDPRPLRPRVGYMSQLFSLHGDLTVRENLELFGGLYGVPGGLLEERITWVLAMASLEGREEWLTRELSGGWRQRLALGAALLHDPPVLFLDEPTSGVDPVSRKRFWKLIYGLAERGTTVFVTTHYMDEAEHCHRLALVHRGRIIAQSSPQGLRREMRAAELLELECDRPLAALQLAKSQEFVWEASLFGKAIHVLVDDASVDASRLARILDEGEIGVRRMVQAPLSLEDLFVLFVSMEEGRVKEAARV